MANKGDDLLVNTPIPSEIEFIHNDYKVVNNAKLNKPLSSNAMTIGDHNSSNANEYIISSSHTPMSVPSSLSYVSQNSASPRFASTIMNHSAFLSKHWLPDISESYAQLENKFIKLDNIGNNCFCNINTNDMESSIIASSLHSLKSCNFQLRAGISLLFVL